MSDQKQALGEAEKDLLFRKARTHNHWLDKDVDEALLKQIHDLMKYGPTSANCWPARLVYVKSAEAKERLKPHLAGGNVDKTMAAPVTALIGMDMKFYEHLNDFLFPHADARSWFEGDENAIEETAFRNSSLQGAYLMLAARGLGLDCGPMSGFDADGVAREFFPDQDVRVNFICNLGYGDDSQLMERLPRFDFDDVSRIV